MAGTSARRPIPAVIFILLLSLLSGLVWYRVLQRPDAGTTTKSTTTPSACRTAGATAVAWPQPSTVQISVLKATDENGLARRVAGEFKARGFKIGPIGNDPQTATTTQVRYGPSTATAARLVLFYLPGAKLVPLTGDSRIVVVSVGSAHKQLATNKQVSRAKATPTRVC